MKTLQVGDAGQPVKRLQRKLLSLGFPPGTIDGEFGYGTEAAVLAPITRGPGTKIYWYRRLQMVAIAADARPTIKKIGNRSFFLLIFLLYLLLQRLTNLLLSLVSFPTPGR